MPPVQPEQRASTVEVIGLLHHQSVHWPDPLKDADDALAELVFAVEAEWYALERVWKVLKDELARVTRQQVEHVGDAEGGLSEVDARHGGPEARAQLRKRLRALADAYRALPFFDRCPLCGS